MTSLITTLTSIFTFLTSSFATILGMFTTEPILMFLFGIMVTGAIIGLSMRVISRR